MSYLQKITPCLWFDNQAKEAAQFYCSIFNNSRILSDSDLIVEFELDGMKISGLNGGPQFKFTEAVSFIISCSDQNEADYHWDRLISDGGQEQMCGWCKDQFGLSWQIVPTRFEEMMKSGSDEQKKQVMNAILKMKKIIISDLEKVYNHAKA